MLHILRQMSNAPKKPTTKATQRIEVFLPAASYTRLKSHARKHGLKFGYLTAQILSDWTVTR